MLSPCLSSPPCLVMFRSVLDVCTRALSVILCSLVSAVSALYAACVHALVFAPNSCIGLSFDSLYTVTRRLKVDVSPPHTRLTCCWICPLAAWTTICSPLPVEVYCSIFPTDLEQMKHYVNALCRYIDRSDFSLGSHVFFLFCFEGFACQSADVKSEGSEFTVVTAAFQRK